MKSVVYISVIAMLFLGQTLTAQRTFSKRAGFNAKGDMTIIGNVNMQGGSKTFWGSWYAAGNDGTGNNDSYYMRHVDVDGDGSTFNSSSAFLNLPVSKDSVLWAGLYWQGYTIPNYSQTGVSANSHANRYKIKFKYSSSSYIEYTATEQDYMSTYNIGGKYAFQGFIDMTGIVRAYGSGNYFAANIVSLYDYQATCSGWSLVVIYKNFLGSPSRNMVVFDGFQSVATGGSTVNINLSGFRTPASGNVYTKVGAMVFEGDAGLTQDRMRLGATYMTDALNPSSNYFNSSITQEGVRFSNKNPDYTNQLGFDVDVVLANNVLPNNATSTSVTFETQQDQYYPGVMVFATEFVGPHVQAEKLFYDAASNTYSAYRMVGIPPNTVENRTVQYHFEIHNFGDESANSVLLLDVIPQYQDYIPGSMEISMDGTNWTSLTDASDTDEGYFDAANDQVVIGIGNAATSSLGGQLLVNSVRYARFKTFIEDPSTFNPPPPDLYTAPNFALTTYRDTSSYAYDANSTGVILEIDNALPVQLVSFTARTVADAAQLNWRTATEINNYGFEVERRSERRDWSRVGFVEGAGTVNSPRSYSFVDETAAGQGNVLHYRLKQIDRDGSVTYSPVVEVRFSPPVSLSLNAVYPNPVSSEQAATVHYSVPSASNIELVLYDVYGKEVVRLAEGMHSSGNYSSALMAGVGNTGLYFLTLSDGNSRVTKKLIVR